MRKVRAFEIVDVLHRTKKYQIETAICEVLVWGMWLVASTSTLDVGRNVNLGNLVY